MVLFRGRPCSSSGRPWRSWLRGSWSWSTWSAFMVRRKTDTAEIAVPELGVIMLKGNVDIVLKYVTSLSGRKFRRRIALSNQSLEFKAAVISCSKLSFQPPPHPTPQDNLHATSDLLNLYKTKMYKRQFSLWWGVLWECFLAPGCYKATRRLLLASLKHKCVFFNCLLFVWTEHGGYTVFSC